MPYATAAMPIPAISGPTSLGADGVGRAFGTGGREHAQRRGPHASFVRRKGFFASMQAFFPHLIFFCARSPHTQQPHTHTTSQPLV